MSVLLRPLPCLLTLSLTLALNLAPATAQDTSSPETPPEAPLAAEPATPLEAPSNTAESPPPDAGEEVEITEFSDWELRCETASGNCFMYQLANNSAGNPVAELRLVSLPGEAEASAGVTVITPLGTLLPEGLVLQVDENTARQYPFGWCTRSGCFSRFGLTADEIGSMQRGNVARLRIVSVSAPDQPVILNVSLSGFTAAYNALIAQ